MTKVAQSASDLVSTSSQCFHSLDSWVPPFLLFQILKCPAFSKYKDTVHTIHMDLVNSWEWPQNIPNMPMEKGSNSLGICHHVLCLGRLRSKHASLYTNSKVSHSHFPTIFTVPPPQGPHHIFKDVVILLSVPNSHPAIPTLMLDPQQCHWLYVQGGPWSAFPNWSLRAQPARKTKCAPFQTPP